MVQLSYVLVCFGLFALIQVPEPGQRSADDSGRRVVLNSAQAEDQYQADGDHEAFVTLLDIADSSVTAGTGSILNLSIMSVSTNTITVLPGASVRYQIVGWLNDDATEGLALFGLTLTFDGGPLEPADIPTGEPTSECSNAMIHFVKPWGITNPDSPCPPQCGFGGTIINGELVQVGGGQNTIGNTPENAPFPIGPVLTGVAQPAGCGATVLVTGKLTAPETAGTYWLRAVDVFANVIREGETGSPFWATQAADVGLVEPLRIVVSRGPRSALERLKAY